MKKFLRLEQISISTQKNEQEILKKISKILNIKSENISEYKLVKKSIDSRDKNNIVFVFCIDVIFPNMSGFLKNKRNARFIKKHKIRLVEEYVYDLPVKKSLSHRPIIIGTGPSSLFAGLILAYAGLKPIFIERGEEMDARVESLKNMQEKGILNPNSNVQFGEGGAGTFSDGKLYTLVNDPRSKFIFETLVECGAPKEILYNAKPHIGTDYLRIVIKNLRKKLINLGSEFRFSTTLTNIFISEGKIDAIELNNNEIIPAKMLILGIGHSARDTFEMLYNSGLQMSQKPFAMGVRIEHKASMINTSQYGKFYEENTLPTASYKLVSHHENARSLYTFCMCPGGYVMPSSSELNHLCVNGMSEYAQDGDNSNSALLVSVLPSDFESEHPLAGIEFQRKWEKKAFELGGADYKAPVQLVGDFLNSEVSINIGEVTPSYKPGYVFSDLRKCLPDFIVEGLEGGILGMEKRIKGFSTSDAVLTAIEGRSSSPIRIFRDQNFESNISGIYPIGEGAGYAGGITSSAIDGLKVGESIVEKL